jgi:hypothetical protein
VGLAAGNEPAQPGRPGWAGQAGPGWAGLGRAGWAGQAGLGRSGWGWAAPAGAGPGRLAAGAREACASQRRRSGAGGNKASSGQAPLAGSSTNTGICREVLSWYSAYGG